MIKEYFKEDNDPKFYIFSEGGKDENRPYIKTNL